MSFLKKIFGPTILVISFLILIYTFYKSEILLDGSFRDFYLNYYFISIILIIFSVFTTFFISEKIKEYLIISSISLVVSLYLIEGYLTFADQLSKERLYKKQTGNKWDGRTVLEIYKDLKKTDNNITIKVVPKNFILNNYSIFPLSGISNLKTINCNESGYYSIFESDRYGFNNPNTEWDKKKIEYLLVGDSFVHGDCVNRPNDISSVLRSLSNKSVLNLGQGGNGSLIEYATLREYLSSNVNKVIWVYFEGNDIGNLVNEKKNNILTNYLKDLNFTQHLKSRQNEIDNLAINFIKEKVNTKDDIEEFTALDKFLHFIRFYNTRLLISPSSTFYKSPLPKDFKKIIRLTKELVESNNSELFFVYLPQYSRYKTNYVDPNYSIVKSIVTNLNIPFIDIHKKVFEKESNPLKLFQFEMNSHYNIQGYKKVAEAIFELTSK